MTATRSKAEEFDAKVADVAEKAELLSVESLGDMTTAQRVAVAMTRVGTVAKKRQTEAKGEYMYRGIEDVTNAVAPILHDLGLSMQVETMAHRLDLDPDDARKRTAVVTCSYSLVGPDGHSHLLGSWVGEADDWSDKATNKAYSAARKLCLLEAFTIPTADMDDTEATVPPSEPGKARSKSKPRRQSNPDATPITHTELVKLIDGLNDHHRGELNDWTARVVKALPNGLDDLAEDTAAKVRAMVASRARREADLQRKASEDDARGHGDDHQLPIDDGEPFRFDAGVWAPYMGAGWR